jgi:glutaminyl-peptide cyclotransferase
MTFGRALVGSLVLVMAGCGAVAPAPPQPTQQAPVQLRPDVLDELPHDTTAFTQGLEFGPNGALYEGTGLEGRSQLRELDPATGDVLRSVPLPGRLFGEGITVVDDRIWQLTWRDGVALEWDAASFRLLRQVPMEGEGWGLCRDGGRLVRSDGTDRLRFHDPATFAETGSVDVTLDGEPVQELNELECVGGQVWANVWQSDDIMRIDPADGHVTAVVDASGLLEPDERAGSDVLNGIAAAGDGEFLVTGKLWPTMFRARFDPA